MKKSYKILRAVNYGAFGLMCAGIFAGYMYNMFRFGAEYYSGKGQVALCIFTALIMASVPMIIAGMIDGAMKGEL